MGVNHSKRAHAILSASGAVRWLNCTPSAQLEDKFSEYNSIKPVESPAAIEGTLAHEFSDLKLRYRTNVIEEKTLNKELTKLRKHKSYTDEMEEEVQKYVVYVLETLKEAKEICSESRLIIEGRLDFSEFVPKGFGTGDALIIADKTIHVIDLKYGKGIQVFSDNNPQLRLYGLGALHEFGILFDIERVKMHIVQPRLNHVDSETLEVDELLKWGAEYVKPRAEKAIKGEGEQKAGEWCRFCKVKAVCRTLAKENLKLARHEFKDPHLLSDSELKEVFDYTDMLSGWSSSVREYILSRALAGKPIEGVKVVEGVSRRTWKDETEVIEVLRKNAFKEEDVFKSTLKGIGDITKLVGKKEFPNLLGELVHKPQGKPTIVDHNDPRPLFGLAQAEEDFRTGSKK